MPVHNGKTPHSFRPESPGGRCYLFSFCVLWLIYAVTGEVNTFTKPCCSSAQAARRHRSSLHGGAISCKPIGKPLAVIIGTDTTGKPRKEIGCVSIPMLARVGRSVSLMRMMS